MVDEQFIPVSAGSATWSRAGAWAPYSGSDDRRVTLLDFLASSEQRTYAIGNTP